LTLIPLADTLLELIFKSRFPAAAPLTGHLLLLLGLFSGMICTREEAHLFIGLSRFSGNGKAGGTAFFSSLLSAFMATIFCWCSVSFIRVGLYPVQYVGFIPDRIFALAMPAAYGLIALRFARQAARSVRALPGWFFFRRILPWRALPVLALFLGTLCSLPAIFKFIWGIDLPDFALGVNDAFHTLAALLRLPALVTLILAALGGTPLFVVIGGTALLLLQSDWGEIDITASQIYTALTQDSLVPIPLFTLAGFILSESRAGERLVAAFQGLFGWLPGGRVLAVVALCAFFTSFTGASGVTILAMGGILYTVLRGYPDKFIIGILTASGSIGLLFPPSLPILLVGASTRTNTVHLFLGGLIPGLLLVAATMVFGLAVSAKVKIPVEPFDPRKAGAGLKKGLLEILLPFLLMGGYFSGIFSMVEVGAAAVLYVFIGETFIYRELRLRDLPRLLVKTLPIIGGILSILALAQALSYYIVDSQAPEYFARWMRDTVQSKWIFLLLLNLALLVTGCLIDIFSAIMIILPLIAPLSGVYGIDPVHMGIIFLVNMEAGFLTPPVGLNLFLASYRFKRSFAEISRNVLPFLLIQLAVVFVVTYAPVLSTWFSGLF
ncbi:MAG: TRAP transporter large permease subunit, partial [Treponema sp.]|nr:TRAP transporter large permease subunit [Treponema sp.]